MSMVRRDVLFRKAQAGKLEAKISYSYDGRVVTSKDSPGNDWKPVRIKEGPDDWKDGFFNMTRSHFLNKSGFAQKRAEGEWELTYADTSYLLREVKRGTDESLGDGAGA